MADDRKRWEREEYDTKHISFDGRDDYRRRDDEDNGMAAIRGEKSRHNRDWRFNTLTDFLE